MRMCIDPVGPFASMAVGVQQPQSFFGAPIYVVEDKARYVLPLELLPGVPWPPGFRDEFNGWSLAFLGVFNPLCDGEVWSQGNGRRYSMNPRTWAKFKAHVDTIEGTR